MGATEDRLPHMHSESEIDWMFPMITAAPIQPNAEDWKPEQEIVDAENENDGKFHGVAQTPEYPRGRRTTTAAARMIDRPRRIV